MFAKSVNENTRGIREKNGIITECLRSEGEVTLPDSFEGVAKNAFDGCEGVLINYPASYIQKKLEWVIVDLMEDIEDSFDDDDDDYEPDHIMRVYDMSPEQIEEAIQNAVAADKVSNEWKVVVIDADDIADQKIETGDTNGILFIKNLNVENVDKLPRNFIYNLIKSHSFNYVNLGPKWLIILEVGKGARLDGPLDIGSIFIVKGNYTSLTPERFMQSMDWAGKVIEPIEETNLDTDKEATNTKEQPSVKEATTETPSYQTKEIDWEERHFQICLALISPADYISPVKIIDRADRMVAALKKHLEEGENKDS